MYAIHRLCTYYLVSTRYVIQYVNYASRKDVDKASLHIYIRNDYFGKEVESHSFQKIRGLISLRSFKQLLGRL